MDTKTDKAVKMAVIWKYDEPAKKQTAVRVAVLDPGDEERFEQMYKEPTYGISYFWDFPDDFVIKEGLTYPLGFDPYEMD